MKRTPLTRRTLLRGLGQVAIALPWLEAMSHSAWAAPVIPKRYLLGFGGCSLGGYSGTIADTFVPSIVGAGYDLKLALANLAPIKDQVTVVTGLRLPSAADNGGVVPPGGRPLHFHEKQVAPLLTGIKTTDGTFNGPTTEHIAGDFLGAGTLFPALVTRVQVAEYLTGAVAGSGYRLSYRSSGGALQQVAPRYSPHDLFVSLFANLQSGGVTADQVAEQKWRTETRRSVLDSVVTRGSALSSKLGRADRAKLDDHLQQVRELELRVAAIPPPVAGACRKPTDPGADPAIGSGGSLDTYSQNLGYSGEDQRAEVICDLIHMALACDLTRSVLFQMTVSHCWMNMYQITGQLSDLHEISHGGEGRLTEDTCVSLARGINWHMKHWASLLKKLQQTPEGNGTLLDSVGSVFTFEGGQGFDPESGAERDAHSTENMAMIVAGAGLKKGIHLPAQGKHPTSVLLTVLRAIGYTSNTLGEVSGEIPGLRA